MTLVSRAASQNGTGQAAVEAEDGEAIPTDDPKAFTQLRLGGIDQNSDAFFNLNVSVGGCWCACPAGVRGSMISVGVPLASADIRFRVRSLRDPWVLLTIHRKAARA